MQWKHHLKYNPLPSLLQSGYENIVYFTKRDLRNDPVDDIRHLWELPAAKKIICKHQTACGDIRGIY
ncbi:MAG TPA: hypothetical protein VJB65_04655 [Patescibacteria group bacterium]|nr:hypothetical protein [Patescibacteria group bacterium]